MNRSVVLFFVCLFLILIFYFSRDFLPKNITGFFAKNQASVNISSVLKAETLLAYNQSLEWGDLQDILVEFKNTGSVPLTEKIEVRIYWNYETGKLQLMAYYYDTQNTLKPGERRSYLVHYLPTALGLFYIKVRIPYDGKVQETWGAFMVTYTPPPPKIEIVYPTAPAPPAPPKPKEVGPVRMEIEYPSTVEIQQNETKMFDIIVKNTGNRSLNNIRLSISTSQFFGIEINPKQVFKLYPNESAIFLISLTAPPDIPEGFYSMDFEVISDEIREGRTIGIRVLPYKPPAKEDLQALILNYEYLILQVQNQIDAAELKGFNVTLPQATLNQAKKSLEIAKSYFEEGKYDKTKKELDNVRKYIEDAVFQLSVVTAPVVYYPAFAPYYLIIIAIAIGIVKFILLIIIRRRKKKEKRPKLLRGIEIET